MSLAGAAGALGTFCSGGSWRGTGWLAGHRSVDDPSKEKRGGAPPLRVLQPPTASLAGAVCVMSPAETGQTPPPSHSLGGVGGSLALGQHWGRRRWG